MNNKSNLIEYYLAKPYWVIDFLPKQVPPHNSGQFFKIEKFFMEHEYDNLLRKFVNILLKLNCYYDIDVCRCTIDELVSNPTPKDLTEWMTKRESLRIILKDSDAMIALNRDDTHMTLFNPDNELKDLIQAIATSEGLFIWKPQQ